MVLNSDGSTGPKKKLALEKKRRAKLAGAMGELAGLLPPDAGGAPLKKHSDVLTTAVKYVKELKSKLNALSGCRSEEEHVRDIRRLENIIAEHQERVNFYSKLLDSAGIPKNIDPKLFVYARPAQPSPSATASAAVVMLNRSHPVLVMSPSVPHRTRIAPKIVTAIDSCTQTAGTVSTEFSGQTTLSVVDASIQTDDAAEHIDDVLETVITSAVPNTFATPAPPFGNFYDTASKVAPTSQAAKYSVQRFLSAPAPPAPAEWPSTAVPPVRSIYTDTNYPLPTGGGHQQQLPAAKKTSRQPPSQQPAKRKQTQATSNFQISSMLSDVYPTNRASFETVSPFNPMEGHQQYTPRSCSSQYTPWFQQQGSRPTSRPSGDYTSAQYWQPPAAPYGLSNDYFQYAPPSTTEQTVFQHGWQNSWQTTVTGGGSTYYPSYYGVPQLPAMSSTVAGGDDTVAYAWPTQQGGVHRQMPQQQ